MSRPRVVIAGLGDSGLLTAIRLARAADVVGISAKPALVSGQELGLRLTRPADWGRDYFVPFDRYRALDPVRTVQAELTGIDPVARCVVARCADGTEVAEPYDALVISTGVSNGFWRRPGLQSPGEIRAEINAAHQRLAAAHSVMVIGGGAAAVSAAANVAARWPGAQVDLYFPHDRALRDHHRRTWDHLQRRLIRLGVRIHPGHRAVVPDGFDCDAITEGEVRWSTGQQPARADAVLWTIGRVRPNTGWLPADMLDADGFVAVTPELQVPGYPGVFAIGDVAATDPLRSSARNRADAVLAHNIRALFSSPPVSSPPVSSHPVSPSRDLKAYRPPGHRWGSVIGPQSDGMEVFAPNGRPFRVPARLVDQVLMPWVVRRGIYHGIRDNPSLG